MKKRMKRLQDVLTKLVGRTYDKKMKELLSDEGAFAVLIQNLEAIKARNEFTHLEQFIILMGMFQQFSWRFLRRARLVYLKASKKAGDQNSQKAECLEALIVLLAVCGNDRYKRKEHISFVKYDGGTVLLWPEFMHQPNTPSFFEKDKKKAKGLIKGSYANLEADIHNFIKVKTTSLKKDLQALKKLYN
ncbi:MAG: hypothetical protein WCG98_09610 [bacterium]